MWSTLAHLLVAVASIEACKNSSPTPKPRCQHPNLGEAAIKMGAKLFCSGFGDRYLNTPKKYEDLSGAIAREGGVIENRTMVFKQDLVEPKENPASSTCHLVCPLGLVPELYATDCVDGDWSRDPGTLSCVSSPCGSPQPPINGKYWCYGNPAICYLQCDPGYVSMASKPVLQCTESSWDQDPAQLVCEEAVAFITGGLGDSTYEYKEKGEIWPEVCQTSEVFSLKDEKCSLVHASTMLQYHKKVALNWKTTTPGHSTPSLTTGGLYTLEGSWRTSFSWLEATEALWSRL